MKTFKNNALVTMFCLISVLLSVAFKKQRNEGNYRNQFNVFFRDFSEKQMVLIKSLESDCSITNVNVVKDGIYAARISMKKMDFWLRYLDPISYKKINGPLPVEWETEVFEKYERPYRREGSGLTLAELYLEEEDGTKDSLLSLLKSSMLATGMYASDQISAELKTHDHFFLCNRLYLLNLASIYTTGFECPDPEQIVPELRSMMQGVSTIYQAYNESFPETALPGAYFELYRNAISFVNSQQVDPVQFNHFVFIRDFVNPLFAMNQSLIKEYKVQSKSTMDYALNKTAGSIFSKGLYNAQNTKGIFIRVNDKAALAEIESLGKLLFYDPILSGNNERSCASCHKPDQFFTDTANVAALRFNKAGRLPRNTPTLLNAPYNHLLMLDGLHYTLEAQAAAVITNSEEMACSEKDMLKKIKSCGEYKAAFEKLTALTPHEPELSMTHVASALIMYYSKFSTRYAPFDAAMNNHAASDPEVEKGFNIFMSKAQCATCHFAPQFNGVKPPYAGSEFEVLGTPGDTGFKAISSDPGRYSINPARETAHAFRTGTLRNAMRTKPYMHNGVFNTMDEVIAFYNAGGGAGKGIHLDNQTLAGDSLHLSKEESRYVVAFITSLNEEIEADLPPAKLPKSRIKQLNARRIGGTY